MHRVGATGPPGTPGGAARKSPPVACRRGRRRPWPRWVRTRQKSWHLPPSVPRERGWSLSLVRSCRGGAVGTGTRSRGTGRRPRTPRPVVCTQRLRPETRGSAPVACPKPGGRGSGERPGSRGRDLAASRRHHGEQRELTCRPHLVGWQAAVAVAAAGQRRARGVCLCFPEKGRHSEM